MGVPVSDIPKFVSSLHRPDYFPPIATDDLRAFGLSADFRRSFIPTSMNTDVDSFVRFRFNTEMVGRINGSALVGSKVRAPYSKYGSAHLLPLATIKMDTGTPIVTSVPSDAPDDWAAFQDLVTKPGLRAKYGVDMTMIEPFPVVRIVDTSGLGS
jgi:leucyl-tRNA synthetase